MKITITLRIPYNVNQKRQNFRIILTKKRTITSKLKYSIDQKPENYFKNTLYYRQKGQKLPQKFSMISTKKASKIQYNIDKKSESNLKITIIIRPKNCKLLLIHGIISTKKSKLPKKFTIISTKKRHKLQSYFDT